MIYREMPLEDIPQDHYRVVLADPPWRYLTYSAKGLGKSADRHYNTMSIADIKALPVRQVCAKDAVVLMWIIDSHVEIGMDILKAWGFTYKTVGLYWVKTNATGDKFPMGTGFWTRANPEHAFLATVGDEQEVERLFLTSVGQPKRQNNGVPRLMVSPRREHSRKPDETHDRVERLLPGPYLEMFSRTDRRGWDVWGAEAGHFSDEDARKKILHDDLEAGALI